VATAKRRGSGLDGRKPGDPRFAHQRPFLRLADSLSDGFMIPLQRPRYVGHSLIADLFLCDIIPRIVADGKPDESLCSYVYMNIAIYKILYIAS
jgi:hypothetical protein